MKTIYELKVCLHEGDDISLGLYETEDLANTALDEEREEWQGPNVTCIHTVPRKLHTNE